MGSVGSERLLPEEPETSTPFPLDRGQDSTSNGLDATESSKVNFHGPTSAMFDAQHPATGEANVASQVDIAVKTQLLAEAVKQRMLLPLCNHDRYNSGINST